MNLRFRKATKFSFLEYQLQFIRADQFIKLMTKKDLFKIFFDDIYIKPPKKNYETNEMICNHIDEIWSLDLANMIDYKISNTEKHRFIYIHHIQCFLKICLVNPLEKQK